MTAGNAAAVREALYEQMRRGLRASRDRRGERDAEIIRDLAVEGLQAADRLVAEVERLGTVEADRDDWIKRLNATERQCDAAQAEAERLQQERDDWQMWAETVETPHVEALRAERDVARADAGKLRAALETIVELDSRDAIFDGAVIARAALAGSDAPPTPSERMHQALGRCWCGDCHTIGEALARNVAAAPPAERET